MKIQRLFCLIAAAAMCLLTVSCGEPIAPTDSDPLFSLAEPSESTAYTGSMVIESAYTKRTTATSASETTSTTRKKREKVTVSFSKKEIIEAANLPAMYQTYGYLDVDGLSVNYGNITVQRDNGIYTIPRGYDLHYITQIDVSPVEKGTTVVLTGTAYVRVLADVPAEEYSSSSETDSGAASGTEPVLTEPADGESSTEESDGSKTAEPEKQQRTVKAVKLETTAKFTIVKYTG